MFGIIAGLLLIVILIWKRGEICSSIALYIYSRGKSQSWKAWLRVASQLGGMSFNSKLREAYMLLKDGDIDDANKKFALLAMEKLTPDKRLRVKSSYALVFWKQGNIDTAIEMLEEVCEKAPNTAVYGSLGYMYAYNGNLSTALDFNQKAYEYNADDPIILDNLAYTYFKTGEYSKAQEFYDLLLEMKPTFPEAYYGYACLLAELGDTERSVEMARRALEASFSFLSMVTRRDINDFIERNEGMTEE